MKFSFIEYVINKFEKEADSYDKLRVNVFTGVNVGWLTPMSAYGIATLFRINPSSIFGLILMIMLALLFFRPIKFWHICRALMDEVEEDEKPKPLKRETQKRSRKKVS